MIVQLVRDEERHQRLGKPRDVLGHVDQRDREIPRRVQNRQSQCAGQDDIAGGHRAALPQNDRPRQQTERQRDGDGGMQNSQSLEVEQAGAPGRHLARDGGVKPAPLATQTAPVPVLSNSYSFEPDQGQAMPL